MTKTDNRNNYAYIFPLLGISMPRSRGWNCENSTTIKSFNETLAQIQA